MGVVICEDGEEGRWEEEGEGGGREGKGGRKEAGEHCLSSSFSWGELLSGPYCETFPLMGPHPQREGAREGGRWSNREEWCHCVHLSHIHFSVQLRKP